MEEKKKVGLILTARTNSSRFPGKVLKSINGKPLISFMIERMKFSKYSDNLILATTENSWDNPLVEIAEKHGIKYYRGDENNVLKRFVDCADNFGFETIVRLYGDSPLTDPEVVDRCVDVYLKNDYDIVTTKYNYPMGIDCEVVSHYLLRNILETTNKKEDLEHVTLYVWKNRKKYKGLTIDAPVSVSYPEYVLTVDEPEDFSRIEIILSQSPKDNHHFIKTEQIIEILHKKKELIKIRKIPEGF